MCGRIFADVFSEFNFFIKTQISFICSVSLRYFEVPWENILGISSNMFWHCSFEKGSRAVPFVVFFGKVDRSCFGFCFCCLKFRVSVFEYRKVGVQF